MAAYEVPPELLDDFLTIKTALSREFCIFLLSGNSALVSYRLACKKLNKKESKTPRNSAHAIQTNSNVFKFITKAKRLLNASSLKSARFSAMAHLETLQSIIDSGTAMYLTGEKQNAGDIIKAIELQREILGGGTIFDDMSIEELENAAGEKLIN